MYNSILLPLFCGFMLCSVSSYPADEKEAAASNRVRLNSKYPSKLRQDGEDAAEAVDGFQAVAGPVAQIINGVLSGNIGQLFTGISGTVTDEAAAPGVGSILNGVSLPLSTLWTNSISAGTKYFNITTPNPLGATMPTNITSPAAGANTAQKQVVKQQQQLFLPVQQPAASNPNSPAFAPAAAAATNNQQNPDSSLNPVATVGPATSSEDDDDDEAEDHPKKV